MLYLAVSLMLAGFFILTLKRPPAPAELRSIPPPV